jgi:hypothetical protein
MEGERAWRKSIRERDPTGKLPLPAQNRSVRRDDLLIHAIYLAYREITISLDTLNKIPFYIRHLPLPVLRKANSPIWRGLPDSRSAWVRYHAENYLNELYIFQNRAEAFLTLLRRCYRNQPYLPELKKRCDQLEEALKKGMAGAVKARGGHVHDTRFDDASLRIIESHEFLLRLKKISKKEYQEFFRDAQTEKTVQMKGSDEQLKKWLNEVGIILGKLLFKESGEFRYPSPPQSVIAQTVTRT